MKKNSLSGIRALIKRQSKKRLVIFGVAGVLVLVLIGFYSNQLIKTIALKNAQRAEYLQHLDKARNLDVTIDPNVKVEFPGSTESDYVGTGVIFLIKSDVVYIAEVIKNSPAERAGLEAGDKIIEIDGSYTSGKSTAEISAAMQGAKGTKVTLNIYRDSFGNDSKDFTITRDLIDNSERRNYFAFMKNDEGGQDLGNYYREYKGKVYFWYSGPQAVPGMVPIDADPNTFTSFTDKYCTKEMENSRFNTCDRYGKDNKKVFMEDFEIKGADPSSFVLLDNYNGHSYGFSKDNNSVFNGTNKLQNADPSSFQLLNGDYGKDKNRVYYEEEEIVGADPGTFVILDADREIAKDKNSIFLRAVRLDPSEYGTFNVEKYSK